MNAALKATIAEVPERTIRAVCGSVAVGTAAAILFIVGLFHPSLGSAVAYGLIPFGIAVIAWAVLGTIRLWLAKFLPREISDVVVLPRRLQPWIRGWLMIRFGLLGGGLLLLVIGVAVGLTHRDLLGVVIQAFVFLVWGRILLDAAFGAAFNAWVIASWR